MFSGHSGSDGMNSDVMGSEDTRFDLFLPEVLTERLLGLGAVTSVVELPPRISPRYVHPLIFADQWHRERPRYRGLEKDIYLTVVYGEIISIRLVNIHS